MALRLFVQNCYWTRFWNKKKRFDYLLEEIKYFNADVVCLQEVVFARDQKLVDSPELISIRKRGIWNNKGGLLTLVRDDSVQNQIWNKYSDQGSYVSWQIAERFLGKGFQAIKLQRNDVWIINTHLSANHSLTEKPQQVQVRQVQQILDFVADKDEVILAGDLNITPFSEAYKLLMTVFDDCAISIESISTFPRKAQTLDYVMYKGSCYDLSNSTVVRYEDAPCRVSDHFGLVVELTNKVNSGTVTPEGQLTSLEIT